MKFFFTCFFPFRNGKSKGIAYIEFENEKSASTAVMKMDQKEYMDRVLTVAISAPPSQADKGKSNSAPSFSGARKPMVARADQKSRISFIPASVQKAAAATKETTASPQNQAMSNDDFRKMLLK